MAKSAIVDVEAGGWVQLTDDDATKITIVHEGGGEVRIEGTPNTTTPTKNPAAGLPLRAHDPAAWGFLAKSLSDMFPDVTTPVRVWAWTDENNAKLLVRHD